MAISVISPPPAGLQPEITANGILQGNGTGVVTAAAETEVELVEINKTTVGLSNVDNTSDADKPVSTATQIALDKKRVVNENLVDNWYFGNPVNQRGQTSYAGTGYGLDRWYTTGATLTAEVTAEGVKLYKNAASANPGWAQALESADIMGMTATVSLLYKGNGAGARLRVGSADSHQLLLENVSDWTLVQKTFTVGRWSIGSLTDRVIVAVQCFADMAANAPLYIKAIKLELGTEQTLAHQDTSGNWVLSTVPNYGEQVYQCQRYFYRKFLTGTYVGLGFGTAFTASRLRTYFPLPTTMRAIPAVSAYSAVGTNDMEAILSNPNSPIKFSLTDITTMAWDKTNICIEFAISGGTQGSQYQIRGNGASGVRYIDFSAEL